MKNYYKILGVSENATDIDIKKAYRQGALFWHPDKNKSANAKEKFIELQEAYEILSDPNKKRVYDELIKQFYSKKETVDTNQTSTNRGDNKESTYHEYQKFEEWIKEIRKNAERKANMPFVDDVLTESFHFLDKYGTLLVIIFVIFSVLFTLILYLQS
jgi:DnaJ-class molecular chaperone